MSKLQRTAANRHVLSTILNFESQKQSLEENKMLKDKMPITIC